MEKLNMKDFFTLGDTLGYSSAGIIILVSQIATGLTAIVGFFAAIVVLLIQLKRLKKMGGK